MKTNLRMKCPNCGYWNSVPVDKIFVEQPSPEAKVRVMLPMYEPMKTERCKKCGKLLAEPTELIRIVKT
jgi:uncharacterized Zn finger protein